MTYNPLPPLAELSAVYEYNPETGEIKNKNTGYVYPCSHAEGYVQINFEQRDHLMGHRVAWYLMTGEDPTDKQVDHINQDRSDNRWCNLRLLSHRANQYNSNAKGYRERPNGRFQAFIMIMRKQINLGTYDTAEEAREVYLAKRLELIAELA